MVKEIFLNFERNDYISCKKEILGLLMETLYLKRKIKSLVLEREKKNDLKRSLEVVLVRVKESFEKFISFLPKEEIENYKNPIKKKKEKKKEENLEKEQDFSIKKSDDLEAELFLIKKKIEALTKNSF